MQLNGCVNYFHVAFTSSRLRLLFQLTYLSWVGYSYDVKRIWCDYTCGDGVDMMGLLRRNFYIIVYIFIYVYA
jgi:hypothetical protein